MTFPLPWSPSGARGRAPGLPALGRAEVDALEAWLASGLESFATTRAAGRCVRVWQGRHRWHAYDDDTGEILTTIPNPHNGRRFAGQEVPPCHSSS